MQPDTETRLKAMLRSLREVIIPAIASDEKLAVDQANIVAANIAMLIEQHDMQLHYLIAELRDYRAFLQDLLEISATPASQAVQKSRTLLDDLAPALDTKLPLPDELAQALTRVKTAVDEQVQTLLDSSDPQAVAAVTYLTFKYARPQLLRERAWVAKAGFELEPEKIPSLEELLSSENHQR